LRGKAAVRVRWAGEARAKLDKLERQQRMCLGQLVPPPVKVELST
jgi:hypothetical protein